MGRLTTFFLLCLASLPTWANAQEVVLYFDLNSRISEVAKARAAAESLAYGFVSIPDAKISYRLGVGTEAYVDACDRSEAFDVRCLASPRTCDREKAQRLENACQEAEASIAKLTQAQQFDPNLAFEKIAAELEKKGDVVTILVISGHHSGGSFDGDYLTTKSLEDGLIKETIHAHPKVFKDVSLVALWGCATVTNDEIADWRERLPSVKVIGGYYGSAPLGTRKASGQFLGDLILKSASLPNITNPKQLQNTIAAMGGVTETNSSVFVHTNDQQDWLYYRNHDEAQIENFVRLTDKIRCEIFTAKRLPDHTDSLDDYFLGVTDLPTDGNESPLRRTYFDLLQNIDCYAPSTTLFAPAQAGLMRFYNTGFKQNFTAFFRSTLESASQEWAALNPAVVQAELKSYWSSQEKFAEARNQIATLVQREATIKAQLMLYTGDTDNFIFSIAAKDTQWKMARKVMDKHFQALPRRLQRRFKEAHENIRLSDIIEDARTFRPRIARLAREYTDSVHNAEKVLTVIRSRTDKEMENLTLTFSVLQAEEVFLTKQLSDLDNQIQLFVDALVAFREKTGPLSLSQFLRNSSRSEFVRTLKSFESVMNTNISQGIATGLGASTTHLRSALYAMNRILFKIDPACVDLLEWHAVNPGRIPQLKCTL